jgi:hypothetical protein
MALKWHALVRRKEKRLKELEAALDASSDPGDRSALLALTGMLSKASTEEVLPPCP